MNSNAEAQWNSMPYVPNVKLQKCIYYCLLQPISCRFIKICLSEETCCSLEWQVFTAVLSSGSEFHSTWKKLGIFEEKEKKLLQDKNLLKSVCVVEN